MGHDLWLESLRRAAGSPDALGRVLVEDLPTDALQQIGDALIAVSELANTSLSGVVDRIVKQLRERRWDGDDELADALDHVVGHGASPLQPLPVELDDVGDALRQQAGSANYLDLQNGTVWLQTMTDFGVDEDLDVDFEDETRWLFLEGEGSHDAYQDLESFIATVEDNDLAARLTRAIDGRGPFKRFRGVLERDSVEYTRWHRFDADARLGHARRWLADHGYEARPARRTDLS